MDGSAKSLSAIATPDGLASSGRPAVTHRSHRNTWSSGLPNTSAMRKAHSRVGEYLPASMAAIVCRVTPTRWPRSLCVISPAWKRSARIALVKCRSGMPAPAIPEHDYSAADDFRDGDEEQRRVHDIPALLRERDHHAGVDQASEQDVIGDSRGTPFDETIAFVFRQLIAIAPAIVQPRDDGDHRQRAERGGEHADACEERRIGMHVVHRGHAREIQSEHHHQRGHPHPGKAFSWQHRPAPDQAGLQCKLAFTLCQVFLTCHLAANVPRRLSGTQIVWTK